MNGDLDSDGNAISVLEKLLENKKPARIWWKKYFCCCIFRKKVRFEN
jgi:hypothetical protein